jgi:cellulose synthase/poly-beta-1,6-N-acetylglucosamine synthase-like glycosyltransferase
MQLTDIALLIATILLSVYVLLLLMYTNWFRQLKLFKLPLVMPVTKFSIIIPARNEADNIESCLHSIFNSHYPHNCFEVIVVDDHSTDNTAALVKQLQQRFSNLQVIELAKVIGSKQLNAYKKKAVETAIAAASNEWIVTTDADCIVNTNWLVVLDAYIQTNDVVWVAGPVRFITNRTWISIFQAIDFLGLQGITAAAVSAGVYSMSNGANLAYKKSVFNEVGGFKGIDDIASGDDMLLMEKIKTAYPDNIGYIFSREAIVDTAPMPDWKSFINQRIRWASKSTQYKDGKIFFALIAVYLLNLAILLFPIFILIDVSVAGWWLLLIAIKAMAEFIFLYRVATFFRQRTLLGWFFLLQPVHIYYIVLAGWMGKFGSYKWKGRTVK